MKFFLSYEATAVVGTFECRNWSDSRDYVRLRRRETDTLINQRDPEAQYGIPRKSFENPEDELKGIQMMSRGDVDRTLDFEDRRLIWRRLISFWMHQLRNTDAEIVYFSDVPHEVDLFALWVAAKRLGVTTICGIRIPFLRAKYLVKHYCDKQESIFTSKKPYRLNTNRISMMEKIHALREQTVWTPEQYVTKYWATPTNQTNRETASPSWTSFSTAIRVVARSSVQTFGKIKFWKQKGEGITLARIARRIGNSIFYWSLARNNAKQAKSFLSVNNALTDSRPFAIFHLHYEPEMNVNPLSNGKTQLDAVYAFRELIPDHIRLLVAEHPNQYDRERAGFFTGRSSMIYSEILSIPNTFLVSGDTISQHERDRAEVVATITGSAGLEQALRGKVVAVYGCAWYTSLSNVFQSPKNYDDLMAIGTVSREVLMKRVDQEMDAIRLGSGAVTADDSLNPKDLKRFFDILINTGDFGKPK